MSTVILLRHGRTTWNADGRFQGHQDVPLDDVGLGQAEAAAAALARLAPDRLVASDLSRAAQTARVVSDVTGLGVHFDADLREIFGGRWEGLPLAEIARIDPEGYNQWMREADPRPGGGESLTEVGSRGAEAVLRRLPEVGEGGTLLAVTHGGVARGLIGCLLKLPVERWRTLRVLDNGCWAVLRHADAESEWQLATYNAHPGG